jgi:hypothetical protein
LEIFFRRAVVMAYDCQVFFLEIKVARENETFLCASEEVAMKIVRAYARLVAIQLMSKNKALKLDLSDSNNLPDMLVASKDLAYSIDARDVITDDVEFVEETRQIQEEIEAEEDEVEEEMAADAAAVEAERTGMPSSVLNDADDTLFGRMDEV